MNWQKYVEKHLSDVRVWQEPPKTLATVHVITPLGSFLAGYGETICSGDDRWNEAIGKTIAISRALSDAAAKLAKNAPMPQPKRRVGVIASEVKRATGTLVTIACNDELSDTIKAMPFLLGATGGTLISAYISPLYDLDECLAALEALNTR